MNSLTVDPNSLQQEESSICVVRLSTSYWHDARGGYCRKNLTYLKRQCKGWNALDDDMDACGADVTLGDRLKGWMSLPDGVYRVETFNEHRDWETGIIDDYDFRLVPIERLAQSQPLTPTPPA